jgi:hypothetical protein
MPAEENVTPFPRPQHPRPAQQLDAPFPQTVLQRLGGAVGVMCGRTAKGRFGAGGAMLHRWVTTSSFRSPPPVSRS